MATKIQLRRDTSANWQGTNPVLAQGEPGVELDTKKMKVGDGITAWNDLEYVAGGGNEENSTSNMFVKLDGQNGELGPSYSGVISVSTDGLNWTPSTYNQVYTDYEGWEPYHLAVGNGRIVYHTYDYTSDRDELRWAYNPFDKPNLPLGTGSDLSRRGPNGEDISWQNVRYAGGMFVAVGYYYDGIRDDYFYPIAAYSADGDSWSRVNINLDYIHDLIQAEVDAHDDVDGLLATDVAYGTDGWLFVMHWGPNDYTNGQNNAANAFYVTDLATELASINYITGIPGAYTVKYDGKGWVTWSNYDVLTGNGSILYINSNNNPGNGTWTPVDMDTVAMGIIGVNAGSITDVVAGTVNGVHWMVVGTQNRGSFASNNQGATWRFLQTGARVANLSFVSDTNPGYISSWYGYVSDTNGEKVTIEGSNIDQLNGTFYVRYYDGPQGYRSYLYTDYDAGTDTFTGPLNASNWGDVNVTVNVDVEVNYGDCVAIVNDSTDLRVGMVAEGYTGFSTYEQWNSMDNPNVITAIDGNKITMKYPWRWSNETSFNQEFRPTLYNAYGDGITSMAYGDGAFIGFSNWNGVRAYRTNADMTAWTKTTRGNAAQNVGPWATNYLNSVAYGEVTTPSSTLINNSETIPGYASYLSVGDSFKVNVTGGDPEWTDTELTEGYSIGFIDINPDLSQWYIGVTQDVEGFNGTNDLMIGTYRTGGTYYGNNRHDSIRVDTENYNWRFDDDIGAFETTNLNVEGSNNLYIYTNDGEITINSPFDGYAGPNNYGEGYAQLTWGGTTNRVKVDWYGTHINTEGYSWNFSNDYNGNSDGVLYQPQNAGIQVDGYWWIGDYQDNGGNSNTYIQAVAWSNTYPTDLLFSAEGYDGNAIYVMDRYGMLEVSTGDGVFQSTGYWAIGDYNGNDNYTYIAATDNIDQNANDITVVASSQYWYFNRDGTFQLPPGGDIVDDNGDSVLNMDIPQNHQTSGDDYYLQITDRGRHIYKTDATGNIIIPTNASVDFPIGTSIVIVTGSHSTQLRPINQITTTLILSQAGADTNVNIPADTYATLLKIETEKWIVQIA